MRRLALAALPLFIAAAPALAQDATPERPLSKDAAWLSDPAQQEKLAQGMAAIIDAMMQVKVGPLADVIAKVDPQSDAATLPRDATLAQAIGSDGRDGERMGDQVRSTARMTSTAAQVMGAYLPVLRDMARDVAAQVERQYREPQKSDQ
jgi:hypothetical protein